MKERLFILCLILLIFALTCIWCQRELKWQNKERIYSDNIAMLEHESNIKTITTEKELEEALSKKYDEPIIIKFQQDTPIRKPITIPSNMTILWDAPYGIKDSKRYQGYNNKYKLDWWGPAR